MGRVFAARYLPSAIDVAVKVLRSGAATVCRELFAREARVMQRVHSQHVPAMLAFRVHDDLGPALVMERVAGEELANRIRTRGALPLEEVRAIVSQVAGALEDVHAAGVVHADVKAENVVVRGERTRLRAKLIDFGIARVLDATETQLETDASPSGTPASMSSEQILNPEQPSTSWDVWALAILAFHCLTATTPHPGKTLAAVLVSIGNGSRPSVSARRIDVARDVDAVFDRAFAADPAQRFQTPREFCAALDRSLAVSPAQLPMAS